MKKVSLVFLALFAVFALSACTTQAVTCGEGTIIKDGKCVAANIDDDTSDPTNDNNNGALNCDDLTGTVFYEVDFANLENSFVNNEVGNEHTANNFVIWGETETGYVIDNASVVDGSLVIENIDGDQFNRYYDYGLGFQFLNFASDVNYTVCAIIEGPTGQTMTSEIGIYYGFGTKDTIDLTGDQQLILQDFRASDTTNTDRGQYVLFIGNVSGSIKVHMIKIVISD